MADHFSDIGFHFESVEDMEAFLMSVFPEQTTVCELPIGKLAFYAQENGLRWCFILDNENEVLDHNFHFMSGNNNPVRVMECLQSDTNGTSGLFRCEIDLDEGDGYDIPEVPINLYLPVSSTAGAWEKGTPAMAQIACYAESMEVYSDRLGYEQALRDGSAWMAAEGFIPSGTFHPRGDANFQQDARAILSGVVEYAERLTNEATQMQFDHLQVRCLGITFDVLADPELYDALPEIGSIIHGEFWMTALVLREEELS